MQLTVSHRAFLKQFSAPYCYKVKVLLYAHLLRIEVTDAGLIKGKFVSALLFDRIR